MITQHKSTDELDFIPKTCSVERYNVAQFTVGAHDFLHKRPDFKTHFYQF